VAASRRFGRYVVIERVGVGGMGEVFAAYDPELDRKVALKLIRPGRGHPDARARLLREAQAMARAQGVWPFCGNCSSYASWPAMVVGFICAAVDANSSSEMISIVTRPRGRIYDA